MSANPPSPNNPQQDAPNIADAGDDKGHEVGAGLMRALARRSRALMSLAARVDIGSLPHTVPMRQVAENLSTAIDFVDSIKHAKAKTTVTRLRDLLTTVRHAVPPFVRNAILGTALFATYEDISLRIEGRRGNNTPNTTAKPDTNEGNAFEHPHLSDHTLARLPYSFTLSTGLFSGLVAGTVHGVLALGWDSIAARKLQPFVLGTTLHHTVSHATLFAVYEVGKRVVDDIFATDKLHIGGLLGIATCGAIAGTMQELVSFYTAKFETEGIRNTIAQGTGQFRQALTTPNLRALLRHAPAISIGFVAFEYGKEVAAANT